MSRYRTAEMICKSYIVAWGVCLIGMVLYGYMMEGPNSPTIELVDVYVGPIGASVCCLVFAFSAAVMASEANRGRCS